MMTSLKPNIVLLGLACAMISSAWAMQQATPEAPAATPAQPEPSEPASSLEAVSVSAPQYRFTTTPYGDTAGVAVIPSAQTKPDQITALTEDIGIMCRIFDKRLTQERLVPAKSDAYNLYGRYLGERQSLNTIFGGWTDPAKPGTTRAIYIEGYGPLFLLNVDFPLSAPPQIEQDQPPQEQADTVWTETKREMYEPRVPSEHTVTQVLVKYDAKKVDQLTKTLTKALIHAANIRDLKPTDWVTVMVRGSEPARAVLLRTREVRSRAASHSQSRLSNTRTSSAAPAQNVPSSPAATASIVRSAPSATVLTIRARKSDIDTLSQKKLDDKEFQKRVQTVTF